MEGILKQSFRLNLLVLKFIGLYPSENHTYSYIRKLRSYIIFCVAMFPASVLCFLQLFLKGNVTRADSNDIASIGIIFLAIKILSFLVNSEDLQHNINNFDIIFPLELKNNQKRMIEDCIRIGLRNTRIFCIGVGTTVTAWLGTLCFQDFRLHLPLNAWFPFKYEDNPKLYVSVYFTFVMGVIYTGMACATIDPLIPGLLCHASGQVQVLKDNLRNLDAYVNDEIIESSPKINKAEIIYNNIKKYIVCYKNILDFVKKHEKCCSSVVITQFMESIFVIGLCCLQIIKIQAMNINLIIVVNYLCTFLFQVYFYCYYGTILLEENNTVSTAIYMSNWYEYTLESKRSLILLMERSKRPLVVTAGKVLDLSLETFTMILNRSYSLIAVFKNYY